MQQLRRKSSRIVKRTLALVMALAMILTSFAVNSAIADAAKKKKKVKVNKVTMKKPNTKVLVLKSGKTFKLQVNVKPKNKANKKVTWKSSKPKVVSINKKGQIKARAKKGSSKITATSTINKKKKATLTVKIGQPITKVTVSKKKLTLDVGKEQTIKATYKPKKATHKKITWKSSKNAVAKVDKGKIIAVKKGTATITATAADGSGKKAKCKVTVKDPDIGGFELVEDFSKYDLGYDWPTQTRRNVAADDPNRILSKQTVVADPENAANKVLEVKPAGYNNAPVFSLKLPEGKTLNDYQSMYIEVRVQEGDDVAHKRAAVFFDKPGAITNDTLFQTYDSNTVEGLKQATAEQAASNATTEWANETDEQLAVRAYNNRFFQDIPMAAMPVEDNNRFMPMFSQTRADANEAQEDGWTRGWKKMILPFQLQNIPNELLGLNQLDMAVGANYNDSHPEDPALQCKWYLNCVMIEPKPSKHVPIAGVVPKATATDLIIGTSMLMGYDVQPADASDKRVTWSSSNTNLASIDEKTGEVKGLAAGLVDIIATSVENPAISGRMTINVMERPPAVDVKVDLSKVVPYDGTRPLVGDKDPNLTSKPGEADWAYNEADGSLTTFSLTWARQA